MKREKYKAFTLIEILLALAILGVGLVSVLSLFTVGLHSTKTAIDMTRAGLTAQLLLETIKQQGYKTDAYTLPLVKDYSGSDIEDISNFSFQINTTQTPISYIANWSKIELVANYKNPDGSTGKEIGRFVTYIAKTNP